MRKRDVALLSFIVGVLIGSLLSESTKTLYWIHVSVQNPVVRNETTHDTQDIVTTITEELLTIDNNDKSEEVTDVLAVKPEHRQMMNKVLSEPDPFLNISGVKRIIWSTSVYGRSASIEHYLTNQILSVFNLCERNDSLVTMTVDVVGDWSNFTLLHTSHRCQQHPKEIYLIPTVRYYPQGIAFGLSSQYQEVWLRNRTDFDWFVYTEYDIEIKASQIYSLMEQKFEVCEWLGGGGGGGGWLV